MAQLHSTAPLSEITPASEREACRRLAESLPERVELFHSVPFVTETGHGARDGEIDLVVVDPEQGVLVLEVKGGKEIGRDSGSGWYSIGLGGEHNQIKNPFQQARRNLYAVRDRAREEVLGPRRETLPFTYGHGCVFPNAVVRSGPLPMEVKPELCIDARTLQSDESPIDTLFEYYRGQNGREEEGDEGWVEPLIDRVLAPPFRAEESLRVRIQREQAQFVDLTDEQAKTYETVLRANRKALVEGVAGTGKTILAQRRATELAEAGHETLYLCFNRLLADHLTEDLSEVSNLTVATFHELADVLSQRTLAVEFPEDPDQAFWDEGAAELLLTAIEATGTRYDAVLVDEAQDFRETWWIPIKKLIGPESYFYVFYDPEQNVYDTNIGPIESIETTVPLRKNCRTTSRIREFAETIVDLGEVTDAKHLTEGEPVETYAFEEREEQIEILEDVVRHLKQDIGLSSSEIVLLSPFTREKSVLEDRLAGYHVQQYALEPPSEEELYHSTILGFKGMDAPAVVVFDVLAGHVASEESHVYVGCSRAQNLLYLLHEEGWQEGTGA